MLRRSASLAGLVEVSGPRLGASPRSPGGEHALPAAGLIGAGRGKTRSPPTRLPRCRRTVPEALPPRAVMWNPLHETDSASVA